MATKKAFLSEIVLLCAKCSGKAEGKDISSLNASGFLISTHGFEFKKIGERVPAIPTRDGKSFWVDVSTPEDGWNWWKKLPNFHK